VSVQKGGHSRTITENEKRGEVSGSQFTRASENVSNMDFSERLYRERKTAIAQRGEVGKGERAICENNPGLKCERELKKLIM